MNLSHIQRNLPWTVPYTTEFNNSKLHNPARQTCHDMLHIMKSAGRIADACEMADHGYISMLPLRKELASIAMSVLHIAQTHGINLEVAIKELVKAKNGVEIPDES